MNTGPLQAIVQRLRRAAAPGEGSPSDGELLSRYVAARDGAAFAEIVQRHGPLVWALCRSGLPAADADDAFQATFLVLARNARRIRRPASLACWLSGVARHAVRQIRRQDARRRRAEGRVVARAAATDGADPQEWRDVLNEELNRLPEKYRLPLLLCYYQGLTNEEAARRLGWPHGTVCGRLARARNLLRRRLARRGMALEAGAIATGSAWPSADLLAATLKACIPGPGTVAGQAIVRRTVVHLAEGMMYAAWLTKVQGWVIGILAVAILGGGTAGWMARAVPAQAPRSPENLPTAARPPKKAEQPPANSAPEASIDPVAIDKTFEEVVKPSDLALASPADDELQKLRKERHQIAIREFAARTKRFMVGARDEISDLLLDSLRRVVESEIDLTADPAAHVVAYERWVKAAKAIEDMSRFRFEKSRIAIQDLEQSRYVHVTARIKLQQAKQAAARVRP